jgi:hypothetical protein
MKSRGPPCRDPRDTGWNAVENPVLKRKDGLKIKATIRRLDGASTARATPEEAPERVGLAEQGRADHTLARPQVHFIEKIPGVGAEREVEAPAGGISWPEEAAGPATSTQPARAKAAAPAAATAWATPKPTSR